MSTAGPCERTMVWLREQGYTVEKVEHRLPRGFTTVDFMGFADILALHGQHDGVLAVQATTTPHLQDRVKKVLAEPRHKTWLACSNRIWVVGWRLAKGRWIVRCVAVTESGPIETESPIIEEPT